MQFDKVTTDFDLSDSVGFKSLALTMFCFSKLTLSWFVNVHLRQIIVDQLKEHFHHALRKGSKFIEYQVYYSLRFMYCSCKCKLMGIWYY